jgi:hypothetical protein
LSATPNAATNDWLDAPATRRLKDTILWHLDNVADDNELLRRFEPLCVDPVFPALGWFWAPALYGRNKTLFRPFIGQHFSEHYADRKVAVPAVTIEWDEEVAASLGPWLAVLEQDGEIALFRRVYAWQQRTPTGAIDAPTWRRDLTRRFASATTAIERAHVLQRFALRVELDESSAIELYDEDAALAAPFILEHLPQQRNDDQRELWAFLADRARGARDEVFYFELYRRQIDLETWGRDTLDLCRLQNTPSELRAALEQRHPRGRFAPLAAFFLQLLESRGEDVLEYVQNHLRDAFTHDARAEEDESDDTLAALAELAESNHWTALWAALFVTGGNTKQYNQAIAHVLAPERYNEPERELRLALLSGRAREWIDLGLRVDALQPLDQENALTLYEKHPALLHTIFRDHLQPRAEQLYFELFEVAWSHEDAELTDFLASRYVTGLQNAEQGDTRRQLHGICQMVAERYSSLALTIGEQAMRAARILTLIPPHTIRNYRRLVERNALAHLLFEQRIGSYLNAPDAVRDLLEAGEMRVRELAYRVLTLPDARAEEQARGCVDMLIGVFLEPMRRNTRVLAFAALDRAATTQENAVRILGRARELASLRPSSAAAEALIGLIARILVRFPTLAGPDERQVAYTSQHRRAGSAAATP